MNTDHDARIREIIKGIRDGVSSGPFWIGETGLYVRATRKTLDLFRAVPHYANPLSSLSPVVLNAGYNGNIRITSFQVDKKESFSDCYAGLCEKVDSLLAESN